MLQRAIEKRRRIAGWSFLPLLLGLHAFLFIEAFGGIFVSIVILLRHELSSYTDYWGFWMGLFLIAVVLSKSNGVVGALGDLWGWISRRAGATAS